MPATATTGFLPSFSFYERHESAPIDAEPARIIGTVAEVDARADPVIDGLLRVREFPSNLARRLRGTASSNETPEPFGLAAFTPLLRTTHEYSLGLAGRFWRPDFGLVEVTDADAFVQLKRPDVAKLVLRFEVVPATVTGWCLRTETFVHCPTWRTKALMTPYWLAIRLASGWIRRRTLVLVERRLAMESGGV